MAKPRTLYDKIWDEHLIEEDPDGPALIYIDRHIVHEVTSPQAFEGLRLTGRKVHAPDKTLLVVDHNVPTTDRNLPNPDPESAAQIAYLAENAKFFDLEYYDEFDKRQGIVHIIGPEQGFTLPGVTLVCGDSHTATNGALRRARLWHRHLGSRARLGDADADPVEIEEHARGCRRQAAARRHRQGHHPRHHRRDRHRRRHRLCAGICRRSDPRAVDGRPHDGVQHVGRGRRQSRLHRARTKKPTTYLKGRPKAPKGKDWDAALAYWQTLQSDDGAHFDREIKLDAAKLPPLVTWGTSPEQVVSVTGRVPRLDGVTDEKKRETIERALSYMGLQGGEKISDIAVDRVFIGSCTNARIEDLRAVAKVVDGKKVSERVNAMIVPGSGLVKEQAELEGLDKIFVKAGFEWREPGCSMCLAMNPDKLAPGERCASTSNRNFEGRQGYKGRTHLVSPAMAAAAAIAGHFVDVREWR